MSGPLPTLQRLGHPLASSAEQLRVLAEVLPDARFSATLAARGCGELRAVRPEILQMNVGKRCNQTCRHCHVDAGPDRREVMPDEVVDACLALLESAAIPTLDITGGAPELHPRFRDVVVRAHAMGRRVMDRCNLTIIGQRAHADLPDFFASHRVHVVASLPWYAPKQTDAQRGDGVFEESIAALRALNDRGYGADGTGLELDLVTNPVGAYLPARQASLERDYKRELLRRHGVRFNRLYTITNMPISRFLEFLEKTENLAEYIQRLVSAFNPAAVLGLMCRTTLSVGWDGKLYDCDFNQMLDLDIGKTIFDVDAKDLDGRAIRTDRHCYGCTAGAGSSCGGATTA